MSPALLRVLAVGIFVIENINHVLHFREEVTNVVLPAISCETEFTYLFYMLSILLHALTVFLGLAGSLLFLFTNHHLSTRFLGVFMVLITWSWWFRKSGEFLWQVADPIEFKVRLIHCLKNTALFGFIGLVGHKANEAPVFKVVKLTKTKECHTTALFPRLLIALRPWSFPAALTPMLITFTFLWKQGRELVAWKGLVFIIGVLALQSCANLLNSFCDFNSGLDKPESSGDRTMVDSLVSKSEFPFLFLYLILIWFVSFILTIPSSNSGPYLTVYAIGIALAVLYSAGSKPLKYIGFGDLTVFLAFGPLLVLSAAIAVSSPTLVNDSATVGQLLLVSAPASLLVVAILHANNHRDMKSDAKNNARTVSVRLGENQSRIYYDLLVLTPPMFSIVIGLFTATGVALGGLVLPLSWRLTRLIRQTPKVRRDIDAETAKVMMLFGFLSSLGIACI